MRRLKPNESFKGHAILCTDNSEYGLGITLSAANETITVDNEGIVRDEEGLAYEWAEVASEEPQDGLLRDWVNG